MAFKDDLWLNLFLTVLVFLAVAFITTPVVVVMVRALQGLGVLP